MSLPSRADLIQFLEKRAQHPQKPKEMARALGVRPEEYRAFKELLRELEDSGELYRVRKGRYAPPDRLNLVVGLLRVKGGGSGLVVPEAGGDEIFVSADEMETALHGDKVVVRIERMRRRQGPPGRGLPGGPEGRIIKVLERARQELVGAVSRGRTHVVVTPDDPRIARDIVVPLDQAGEARDRQKVVVEILSWGTPHSAPVGRIKEVLGMPGDPGLDILTIIRHHGLPDRFPDEVEAAAEAIPHEIPPAELARREDWRDRHVITIDPVDAKDFDDALSLAPLGDGRWELGVHIADVSHYVKAGDPIDMEAYRRATSVYLVDRVIPMLPERLSNEMCSLRPEVDRLAMSVVMTVDDECQVLKSRVADTVIHSRRRMTYEKVQAIFDGDPVLRSEYADIQELLENLRRLARRLSARRAARGSLDFDLPESRVILDHDGFPMDIQKVARLDSHRLIEEFMILANEVVARHLKKNRIPGLYRVHEAPEVGRIEQMLEVITPLGYRLKRSKDGQVDPTALQELLARAEGKPEENLVNTLVLRSMRRARYDPRPLGHYGLATLDYLHFTSPIRRYPDLLVHRALRQTSGVDAPPLRNVEEWGARLQQMAAHCSDQEQRAEEAERDSVEVKKAEFMERHLGDEFEGTVTGVTGYGLFVQLLEYHVEGLVHVSTLGDDYYVYREDLMALVGESTKRMFRLGDVITVQVIAVKRELRQIDFGFVGKKGESSVRVKPGGAAPRARSKVGRHRAERKAAAAGHYSDKMGVTAPRGRAKPKSGSRTTTAAKSTAPVSRAGGGGSTSRTRTKPAAGSRAGSRSGRATRSGGRRGRR